MCIRDSRNCYCDSIGCTLEIIYCHLCIAREGDALHEVEICTLAVSYTHLDVYKRQPYYYVGTNFWYGAILGSEGQGGNRERLCRAVSYTHLII